MPSTVARRLLMLLLGCALLGACGGDNPYQSAETATVNSQPSVTDPVVNDNEFLPQRENITECIGAVERPNCGSEAKGGWQMYLTFGVLIAGMGFIAWRVVRSVKARDAVMVE